MTDILGPYLTIYGDKYGHIWDKYSHIGDKLGYNGDKDGHIWNIYLKQYGQIR